MVDQQHGLSEIFAMAESAGFATVAIEFPEFLVMFDLDGVLVIEDCRHTLSKRQFLLLHQNLHTIFDKFAAPVGVLTHRPRREARAILSATGIDDSDLCLIYGAEDLLRVAIKRGGLFKLLHTGLMKSYAVVDISQRAKIAPEQVCVIDDRVAIIRDMESHGIGLRIHVEQESTLAPVDFVRFDADQVSAIFRQWASHRSPAVTVKVHGSTVAREQLQLVDLDLSDSGATLFERVRPIGRYLRKALKARKLAKA